MRGIYPLWSAALVGAAFLQFLLNYRWFKEPDRLGRYIGTRLFGSVLLTLLSPSRLVSYAILWVTSSYISASVALRWKNNLFPNHSSDT